MRIVYHVIWCTITIATLQSSFCPFLTGKHSCSLEVTSPTSTEALVLLVFNISCCEAFEQCAIAYQAQMVSIRGSPEYLYRQAYLTSVGLHCELKETLHPYQASTVVSTTTSLPARSWKGQARGFVTSEPVAHRRTLSSGPHRSDD